MRRASPGQPRDRRRNRSRSDQRLRFGGSGGSLTASASSVWRVRRGPRVVGDAAVDDGAAVGGGAAGRVWTGGSGGSSNGTPGSAAGTAALPAAAVAAGVGTAGSEALPRAGRKFTTVSRVFASA